jgi:hypothetical protein
LKKLTTILALAALSAIASASSPIDNMTANCQEVMKKGACRVAADERDYPVGGMTLISGVGRVSNASYLKIRNARTDMEADGETFTMCAMIKVVCVAYGSPEWNSDDCKVVRGSWKQTPPTVASLWERVYAWVSSYTESR